MTEAEARARIISFADANTEPVLASADLDILVEKAKVSDQFGIWPTDPNWTESYDVNYAVAQAWLLKASRLPNRYLFMSGGKMLSRNQYYEHCMELYRTYLKKSGPRAIRLYPDWSPLDAVPNNWNAG